MGEWQTVQLMTFFRLPGLTPWSVLRIRLGRAAPLSPQAFYWSLNEEGGPDILLTKLFRLLFKDRST